jgi:hypothetical protein
MGTWNHWKDSTGTGADSGWTTAGCGSAADSVDNRGNHARPDLRITATSAAFSFANNMGLFMSIDITALARQWRGDTVAENGVVLVWSYTPCSNNDGTDFINLFSSEYTTDTSLTPRFVFYYTAVTSEPGGLANLSDTLGACNIADTLGLADHAKADPPL